mmetsp:Transcript_24821/g.36730  ORF Transcript_24821/g.36730 Transcript_24821/m.36730 type:complete len:239 (-) Transcript_24821:68-784(-)|eukprot:CAMPEP_0194222214 /NCGR_PEP_ID=MMETSP0156-20130528/32396_1 /TAXON_ID=33649 /ORGANISM="Thalassionema nitzschioides, Strain L26-B" /LENGTH=238 /DNA_ID=CAMNT_0038952909 /DNA_START=30 /DNA_END=746 /DNA_ORIENTATION=+
MARPEEKANAMMNKWVKMREAGNAPRNDRARRPQLASECDHLDDAERFRRQLLREMTDLIAKIQNPGLGEHVLRDVNDEINRKMREKHHWNKRILKLGGPDFAQMELKQQIENSTAADAIVGSGGYRYFGAAKDLPGVKELFEKQQEAHQSKRNRAEIYQRITPDYYGWREEEDGVLLELEAKISEEWRRQHPVVEDESKDDDDYMITFDDLAPLSKEIMEQAMLERKKERLMADLGL